MSLLGFFNVYTFGVSRLAYFAYYSEKVGVGLLMFSPLVALITRVPSTGFVSMIAAFLILFGSVIVQLVTLPVEWDASFQRALPILKAGGYLKDGDEQGAHQILTAAALTYVAASLASLLNVGRWLMVLRR